MSQAQIDHVKAAIARLTPQDSLMIADESLIVAPYMLTGSAVMTLAGIDRTPGDLDIFTSTARWFQLYNSGGWKLWTTNSWDEHRRCDPPYLIRYVGDLEVNVFSSWRLRQRGNFDVAEHMRSREFRHGVPCVSMNFVYSWKRDVGRPKDLPDINLIEKWAAKTGYDLRYETHPVRFT